MFHDIISCQKLHTVSLMHNDSCSAHLICGAELSQELSQRLHIDNICRPAGCCCNMADHSDHRFSTTHCSCSEEEELVHWVQSFFWCSQWVLTPSVVCRCIHVCYSTVFDVYSIGLCMSLSFSMLLCLSFSTDIWTGVKQLCLLQSPLGFIAYLDSRTHTYTHMYKYFLT